MRQAGMCLGCVRLHPTPDVCKCPMLSGSWVHTNFEYDQPSRCRDKTGCAFGAHAWHERKCGFIPPLTLGTLLSGRSLSTSWGAIEPIVPGIYIAKVLLLGLHVACAHVQFYSILNYIFIRFLIYTLTHQMWAPSSCSHYRYSKRGVRIRTPTCGKYAHTHMWINSTPDSCVITS